MVSDADRALLAEADQNIAKAVLIVAQQRALLIDGEWDGEAAAEVRRLLKGYEEALRLMEDSRALLAAQIEGDS